MVDLILSEWLSGEGGWRGGGWLALSTTKAPNQAKGKDSDHLNLVSVCLPQLHPLGRKSALSGPPCKKRNPKKNPTTTTTFGALKSFFDFWNKERKNADLSNESGRRGVVLPVVSRGFWVFYISSAPAIHVTLPDWN